MSKDVVRDTRVTQRAKGCSGRAPRWQDKPIGAGRPPSPPREKPGGHPLAPRRAVRDVGHIKPWHSLRRTDRPCHRGKAGLLRRGQPLHPAPAASSRWDPHKAPLGPFRLRSLVGSSSPRCEDGSGPSPKPATTELGPKAHAGPSRVTKVALKIIRAAGVHSTPPPHQSTREDPGQRWRGPGAMLP